MAGCILQKWASTDTATHVVFSWGETVANNFSGRSIVPLVHSRVHSWSGWIVSDEPIC